MPRSNEQKAHALFEAFDRHLNQQGYLARGGQIIDAAIVPVPKQRNRREDNATIKGGGTPAGWADKPARRAQKDTDAPGSTARATTATRTTSAWTAGTSWCAGIV